MDACLSGIVQSQSGATLLIMVVVVGFVDQEVMMDNSGIFFFPGGSTMMCDGCGFRWLDTLIMTIGFSVLLRDLGFLVGMEFSGGLMTSAGKDFKANKVGLVAFFAI